MTTLVTGASGALGRVLFAHLQKQCTENLLRSSRTSGGDADCLACDLADPAAVRRLLQHARPRLIYHLAGSYANQFEPDYAANALGAKNLFDAIAEQQREVRVVVLGSAAEYGIVTPDENPLREDHPLRPVSPYGMTKSFQTLIAGYYARRHGIDVIVARMFNLLASGLSERLFVGRVERLIERYRSGEVTSIDMGNIDHRRDYIAAEDAAEQLELIANRGRGGDVYHVASGKPVVMRELLYRMLADAGVPCSVVREKSVGTMRTGYDPVLIYADIQKTLGLGTTVAASGRSG